MKIKLAPIAFALFLLLHLSYRSYARFPAAGSFNDSVILKIESFEEFKGFGTGSGYVFPQKGYKFIAVHVHVSNISESKQEVILDEICLPDTVNKVKYRPDYIMTVSVFTMFKKKYHTIKKGDSIYRRLVYAVPKNLTASYLLYNKRLWFIEK